MPDEIWERTEPDQYDHIMEAGTLIHTNVVLTIVETLQQLAIQLTQLLL